MLADGKVIKEENIIINLVADSKEEVIKILSERMVESGMVTDFEQFYADVLERERQISTGIGKNIAIPHGKSMAVEHSGVAFAMLKSGVDWESFDDELVNIVFLLAIKDGDEGTEHLKILAKISEKLMDDEFVALLKNSSTKQEVYDLINQIKLN